VSDLLVFVLTKRTEAQMLADVLPECLERFQLEQRIHACDYVLGLLRDRTTDQNQVSRTQGPSVD
jgi:hypothetical protein